MEVLIEIILEGLFWTFSSNKNPIIRTLFIICVVVGLAYVGYEVWGK